MRRAELRTDEEVSIVGSFKEDKKTSERSIFGRGHVPHHCHEGPCPVYIEAFNVLGRIMDHESACPSLVIDRADG